MMEYNMKIFLLLILLCKCSLEVDSLQCPDCLHVSTTFKNIPGFIESLITTMMGSTLVPNLACKTNTTTHTTCNLAGIGEVNKCISLVITVEASGMSLAPEGSVEMEVVSRGCEARPSSEGDVCNHISTVDAKTQAQFLGYLESLKKYFSTVTYDGQVCYESDSDTRLTTTTTTRLTSTRPTTTRPTTKRQTTTRQSTIRQTTTGSAATRQSTKRPTTKRQTAIRQTTTGSTTTRPSATKRLNGTSSANSAIINQTLLSVCLLTLLFNEMV